MKVEGYALLVCLPEKQMEELYTTSSIHDCAISHFTRNLF